MSRGHTTQCLERHFFLRFPDARVLLQHPDLQFTIKRNETGGVMLHINFLHTGRGVPNKLYELCPPARESSMTGVCDAQQDQHYHHSNFNHVRNVLNTSLPYIPRAEDETMLHHIRGERLLGLQCTADANTDDFGLVLATVHGDVFCFHWSISSLHCLTESGIPHSGLPAEVHEALISAQVVKIVALDSANVEECKSAEKSIAELFCFCLNLNIQTVCNLWKLALFTGFPLRLPPAVSLSFYRYVLLLRLGATRGTSATVPSVDAGALTPTALQIAMCAMRLCGICGMGSSHLDADILRRMLLDDAEEAWFMRNVELRIGRYGATSPQGASLMSLQLHLQYLSLLYGPEVCVCNGSAGVSSLSLMTLLPSQALVRNMNQASSETEQTTREIEKEHQSKEKEEEEKDEQEKYFEVLCGEANVCLTEKQKNDGGKPTGKELLTTEEETTLQDCKNTNSNREGERKDGDKDNHNKEEEEVERAYSAMFAPESGAEPEMGGEKVTPVVNTFFTKTHGSQKKFINTKDSITTNSKSESLKFFLPPPSTHFACRERLQSNRNKKQCLPPAHSLTHMSLPEGPGRSVSCGTTSPSFLSPLAAEGVRKTTLTEASVEKESDMMERLSEEIMRETQRLLPGGVRKFRTGNGILSDKMVELMRELLRLNSSRR